MFNQSIILASKSPRRSQLLKEAGFTFEVKTASVEETYPDDLAVDMVASFLAQKKARAAAHFIEKEEIILAADSIVVMDDTIFGKPKDAEDARRTLRLLSGKSHRVITGVCLLSITKERVFEGVSTVYLDQLSEAEITYYIDNYKPYDKAGSYGIQEWIGLCKVSKIEGTYTNIMGLPIDLVYSELQQF